MKRYVYVLLVLVFFSNVPSAFAHDPKYHKKHYVDGEVTSVSGDSFRMKTADGYVSVMTSKDTTFESGDAGKPGQMKDLKELSHVMVDGTKLETGELVAKEVMIHSRDDDRGSGHDAHAGNSH